MATSRLDKIQQELRSLTAQVPWDDRFALQAQVWNFPYAAIDEALMNAVHHRSYEVREPIEVRIGDFLKELDLTERRSTAAQ